MGSFAKSTDFVNLNPVSKRIADEEPPPRSRAAVFSVKARRLQARPQLVHISALEPKMPARVRGSAWFFH